MTTHPDPRDVAAAARAFAAANPRYGTPQGATDRCGEATARFLDALLDAGLIAPDGLARGEWENADAAVIDGTVHRAARVGARLYDFTARQFDPDAPYPLVTTDGDGFGPAADATDVPSVP